MEEKTIQKLIRLNLDFYRKIAFDFSKTRSAPWLGWKKVIKQIKSDIGKKEIIKVLDLACGNGRFLGFLEDELNIKVKYYGFDTSDKLLSIAKVRFHKASFVKHDVIRSGFQISGKYDLVTVFGLTHHIPGKENRRKWFASLPKLLSKNGLLILTFWNFRNRLNYAKGSIKTKKITINKSELEPGDYLLGFSDIQDAYRYCHLYSKQELERVKEIFKIEGLIMRKEYISDGRGSNKNHYYIFQKNVIK